MPELRHRISLKQLSPAIGLVVFAGAVWILTRQLQEVRPAEIVASLQAVPPLRLALALLLVFCSYFAATLYDALALRSMGKRFPLWQSTLASFISNSFSNTVGFGLLTGGSLRLRLYSTWDLSVGDVSRILLFQTISVWLGFLSLSGIVLLLQPSDVPGAITLPFGSLRAIGIICLVPVISYAVLTLVRTKPLRLFRFDLPLPGARHVIPQILVAVSDWLLGATAMYVLIGPVTGLSFPLFLGVHFLALVAAMASQVPGGLGVLETVYVLSLADTTPAATVLATLLVFRLLFNLIPLGLGMLLLLGFEVVRLRGAASARVQQMLRRVSGALGPPVVSLLLLIDGVLLLASSALNLPRTEQPIFPALLAPAIGETSRLVAAAVGVLLVLLSRAVQRRIDAAYFATIALTALGALASVLGGTGVLEVVTSLFILVTIIPMRRQFYRPASFLAIRPGGRWVVTSLVGLGVASWLAVVFSVSVPGPSTGWLGWVLSPDGPSALQALIVGLGIGAITLGAAMLRPQRAPFIDVDPISVLGGGEPATAGATGGATPGTRPGTGPAARAAERSAAGFYTLASGERGAVLQYLPRRGSWVSLDGPVGEPRAWPELLWSFRENGDRYGRKAIVVGSGEHGAELLLEAAYGVTVLGERAVSTAEGLRGVPTTPSEENDRRLAFAVHSYAEGKPILDAISAPQSGQRGRGLPGRGAQKPREPRSGSPESPDSAERPYSADSSKPSAVEDRLLPPGAEKARRSLLFAYDGQQPLAAALLRSAPDRRRLAVEQCLVADADPEPLVGALFGYLAGWARDRGYEEVDWGFFPSMTGTGFTSHGWWQRIGRNLYTHGTHVPNAARARQLITSVASHFMPVYVGTPRSLTQGGTLLDLSRAARQYGL